MEIFRLEIRKRIQETGQGSSELVAKVRQELEAVLFEIIDHCFGRFEELAAQIKAVTVEQMQGLEDVTLAQIDKMLRVESNFVYQRSGLYETILVRIADKERQYSQEKNRDELQHRVN